MRTQRLFAGHHVRLERADGLPRIVDHRSRERRGARDRVRRGSLRSRRSCPVTSSTPTTLRFIYSSMTTPNRTFDYDMASRERTLRKTQEVPSGHEPGDYVTRRLTATGHDGAQIPISVLHRRRHPARRQRAAAALRLRRLWPFHTRLVLDQPARPGRPRLRVRHRAYQGRRGSRLRLVSRRQARDRKAEHLLGFHRGWRTPHRRGLHGEGPDRGAWRERGRDADGGGRESEAGPVRGDPRRGAVRRRAQHDVRRESAAHPAGMAGMGQPD